MKNDKSYPFPTYSGLLNSEHYDKMGPALWLFLWFISSTTKEIEKDVKTGMEQINPNDIPNIKTSENEKDGTGVVA